MRAAIYARMSTDKQSADSPADQVARCREFAAAKGWEVVDVVEDEGISGASRHERIQFLELMARKASFDVLLCWDFSRLARNEEDLAWVRNQLEGVKKTAIAVSTGRTISDLGSRVEGIFAAEYLTKLRADTHRGLKGRAERELATGGTAFGYRTEKIPSGRLDAQGVEIAAGFRLVKDEAKAAIVLRIFESAASGSSLREIAHALNREGITAPTPRSLKGKATPSWAPTALRVMLHNPIYRGELTWNRTEWVKDHATGKRRRFKRPESEWIKQSRPDLAIISSELWEAAHAALRRRAVAFTRTDDGRQLAKGSGNARATRTKTILAGFLQCEVCGGFFHALSGAAGCFGCYTRKSRGPTVCASTLRVRRALLEETVVGAIRDRILAPENVGYLVARTLAEIAKVQGERDPQADRARVREIDAKLVNLARLAAETAEVAEVAKLISILNAERAQLRARIETAPQLPDADRLRRKVLEHALRLREAFDGDPESGKATLRALLGDRRMTVAADPEHGFRVEGLFGVHSWPSGPQGYRGGATARAERRESLPGACVDG